MSIDTINELPSNRIFGYFFSFIFSLLLWYFSEGELSFQGYIFAIIAVFFFITATLCPSALLPLNKAWMKFGLLLAKFFSPIVLGVLFFCIITPYAFVLRVFGRDELRLKCSKRDESHWLVRSPRGPDKTSFKNQY